MLAVVIVLVVVLLWTMLDGERSRRKANAAQAADRAMYQALLDEERARNRDLLNRLAARNLPEYQAYAEPPSPPTPKEFQFDDWGLLVDEVSR